jgi:hypothetical protein
MVRAIEKISGTLRRFSFVGPSTASLTVILLMTVLVIDTSIFRISDLIRINMTPYWTTPLFVLLSLLFLILLYFSLGFVRSKSRTNVGTSRFGLDSLSKFVLPVQFILSAVIVFVVFQIIVLNPNYCSKLY